MLTIRETMTRLEVNRMGMRRFGSLQWQIFFREDATNEHSVLVDDLEDVVIQAGRMRKEREQGSIPVAHVVPWKFPRSWKKVGELHYV